jgi:hypothetical protein
MIHAFTSAAVNYIDKVRTLSNSLKLHHPEIAFHLALADERPNWLAPEQEGFASVVTASELGIRHARGWIFKHNLIELSTAIKPFVMMRLLALADCEAVVYFDPDIVVFSRLDDLFSRLEGSSILLTPHQTQPETELEAVVDNEIGSLRHGIYNLGFIAVKADPVGRGFASWWAERLRHFCLAAYEKGLWVDQRWIDHVPVFFPKVGVITDSRFNVAAWNITTRELAGGRDSGFTVGDLPLGFYHFSGFDSGAHKVMAYKYGWKNRSVSELIEWYESELTKSRDDRSASTPWAYGSYTDGTPILDIHRFIYRFRRDLQREYPDPFLAVTESKCYLNWFNWRAEIEHPELMGEEGRVKWEAIPNFQMLLPSRARPTPPLDIPRVAKEFPEHARKAVAIARSDGVRELLVRIVRRTKRLLG